MVTREQVEDFILAATLEMGSACDEDWVKECAQILRAGVPAGIPVTYAPWVGERAVALNGGVNPHGPIDRGGGVVTQECRVVGNTTMAPGGCGASYSIDRDKKSKPSTYIGTIVGPDGVARKYQCATVNGVRYIVGNAREMDKE